MSSHPHHHAHDHAAHRPHAHGPKNRRPAAAGLLGNGAALRVALALAASGLLWLTVGWALN